MSNAPDRPLVWRLLKDYCDRSDLSLVATDPLGNSGYVEHRSGKRFFFVGTRFDLNRFGSAELARDKTATLCLLKSEGLQVPESLLVTSPLIHRTLQKSRPGYQKALNSIEDGYQFADQVGYPVYLKPNDGKEGRDVLRLPSRPALEKASAELFERHTSLLLQATISGTEYRVVVLDGEVLLVFERSSPIITGDGERTIRELVSNQYPNRLNIERVSNHLETIGLTLDSTPCAGNMITLLPVANLSAGGMAKSAELPIVGRLRNTAIRCGSALGLRYFGVDMILSDPNNADTNITILEVNAAPGLAQLHRHGSLMASKVEEAYSLVFEAIRRQLAAGLLD